MIFFSYEKKMMLYVFNLKQLHWIQPYGDTNLKLMRLRFSMMIIPNQLFLVQQKWMLISQSTVSLSAQEKFPTEIFIRIYSQKIFLYSHLKYILENWKRFCSLPAAPTTAERSWNWCWKCQIKQSRTDELIFKETEVTVKKTRTHGRSSQTLFWTEKKES